MHRKKYPEKTAKKRAKYFCAGSVSFPKIHTDSVSVQCSATLTTPNSKAVDLIGVRSKDWSNTLI